MKFKMYLSLFFIVFSTLNFVSCKSTSISELSQEDGLSRIKESYANEEWSKVVTEVDEYRIRYPYTQYTLDAELIQADAFFQGHRFAEAIAAYENMIVKNPSDSHVPFAYYRIAKSYDYQAPKSIDRDQAFAQRALDNYNLFLKAAPASEWAADATERKTIIERRLSDHTLFIADFYWDKEMYAAALSRYLIVIKENKINDQDLVKKSKERASVCYEELAKILEKKPTSDEFIFFKNETPQGLRDKAQKVKL